GSRVRGANEPAHQAGPGQKGRVVKTAKREVTKRTVLSGVIWRPSCPFGSMKNVSSNPFPYQAATAPSSAPAAAMTKLSVRYCRIKRHLPAPIAIRTANSCRRAWTVDIINPPTFTQHSSSTTATKPCMCKSGCQDRLAQDDPSPVRAELTCNLDFSMKDR